MEYFNSILEQITAGLERIDVEYATLQIAKAVDWAAHHGIEAIPHIEAAILNTVDKFFSYRQVVRQILILSALQILIICFDVLSDLWQKIKQRLTEHGRKEETLLRRLKEASSYEQWQEIAVEIDKLRGNHKWRSFDNSRFYDAKMLKKRMASTDEMIQRGDVFNLMFRLRGGLARDQFGMQHEGLFSRAQAGTKFLIEKYLDSMADGLNYICDSPIANEEVICRF